MVIKTTSKRYSAQKYSQEAMMHTLDWAYERTLTGLPGQKDIHVLVADYLSKYVSTP